MTCIGLNARSCLARAVALSAALPISIAFFRKRSVAPARAVRIGSAATKIQGEAELATSPAAGASYPFGLNACEIRIHNLIRDVKEAAFPLERG